MKTEARQKLGQYDLAKMQYETFKTIYIAGPMTGLPNFNREAFNLAAMRLKRDGWDVKNPADFGDIPGATWRDYMRLGLKSLLTCSTIYMLKGWEGSKGAKIELAVAKELGMKELYEKGLEEDDQLVSLTIKFNPEPREAGSDAPLESVEARYKDLLFRLGVLDHDGAVAEITTLRKAANLDG